MCRLYAFLAVDPMRVECALIRAQNSLLEQSRDDHGHGANPDGWGIAYYVEGTPRVERRALPALADMGFLAETHRIRSRVVVAHVRRGTAGSRAIRNTHPFHAGRWAFAHNGGIPRFDDVAAGITDEVDRDLLRLREGETDSELIFLWILTRIREEVPGVPKRGAPLGAMVRAVRRAMERMDGDWCGTASERGALNVVLSDGESLAASRLHCELYVLERDRAFACEVCRECHCHDCESAMAPGEAPHGPRAIVVASEPITSEAWWPVPGGTIVGVRPDARLEIHGSPARTG